MSPISGWERTKKYKSMMSEQKKRYAREKDRERKREERKKKKLTQKQLEEKQQEDKLHQQKRWEILKQINSSDLLEEKLLKERRKTEELWKKCV